MFPPSICNYEKGHESLPSIYISHRNGNSEYKVPHQLLTITLSQNCKYYVENAKKKIKVLHRHKNVLFAFKRTIRVKRTIRD